MNFGLLRKIPLFKGLNQSDINELAGYLKSHSVPANQIIFWMEEKGDCLYILESGKVLISYTDEDGKEITLATLGPGSFFGELALIDGGTHTATARALTDSVLLTLDQQSFYLFLDKHPKLGHNLLFVLTSRLRSSTFKLRGIVNVNEQIEAKSSSFQNFIDKLASAFTSVIFLTCCIVFIIFWMSFQVYLYTRVHNTGVSFEDKPPTFAILAYILTLTSFLLTILILNSQRRQAENDRIRGEIEYQVNLKSQTEVVKLQRKMDQVISQLNHLSKDKIMDDEGEAF